jgi:vacuolar protein sorting-associated protein 13A/C
MKLNQTYSLPVHSDVDYAWDYPAAKGKKIQLVINDASRAVDIMEIGNLVPFRFNVSDDAV